MKIEMWPVDKPIDYAKNARKITEKAVDKVALSIKQFGFRQPVVVDNNGVICIGHVRRRAGKKIGMTEIPVHVAADLTPEQIKALRLMDNRSNDEVKFDLELVGAELLDLKGIGVDLALTGFDIREIEAMITPRNEAEDYVPAVPIVSTSRLGDIWRMGPHRLICGDSSSPEVVGRLLDGRQPGLMVTDPPYGISLDTEWRDRAGLNQGSRTAGHKETTITGDRIADWSPSFELVPSVQVAYVWHASAFTTEVLTGLLRIGFLYPQQIIWRKNQAALTRTHYWFQHEPCWYVRKKNAPWFGKPGAANTTIWDAISPKMIMGGSEEEKYDHPTQKPVELMRKAILNHTEPGQLVYEPFGGSGTTLAAAEITGRVCLACELEPKYCDVIVLRWQKLTGKEAVLEGDGRTFGLVKEERLLDAESTKEPIEAQPLQAAG